MLFVVLFSLGNLIQIPGWIFLAAAVSALGRMAGGLATSLAASVSCSVTFVVIRLLGGSALRDGDNRLATRLLEQLDARPARVIALLRLAMQTAPLLNYSLGMSRVRFRGHGTRTAIGLPLPIFLWCVFFDTLAHWLGAN